MKIETVARIPDILFRRFEIENESATSRKSQRDTLRHGHKENVRERTSQKAKRPWQTRLEASEIFDGESGRASDVPTIWAEFPSKRRDRPTNRLGENARGPPGIDSTMWRGILARLPDSESMRRDRERIGNVKNVFLRTAPSWTFGMLRNSSRN